MNFKKKITYFINRWIYSTNHRDIGTLYVIFSLLAGLIGTIFSVLIRLELAFPGDQVLNGDYQFYNVLVSAHGLIMVLVNLIHSSGQLKVRMGGQAGFI